MKLPEINAPEGAIVMLNLIKYKDRQLYFDKYIPAFNQVVKELGFDAKVVLLGKVVATVIAPDDESWDDMVLVEYPSAAAFKAIAESNLYHEIANPLRVAATADLRLLMTQRIEL